MVSLSVKDVKIIIKRGAFSMKIIHLSDLHIGKKLNGYSLIEDQQYILRRIFDIIEQETPDCVIIAGDVYDKAIPSTEAVDLLDSFLVELSAMDTHVFIISGNHDSPERLAFASRLISNTGIHISPVYSGSIIPDVMEDSFGSVGIYMLPFVKPANVRHFFPDAEISSYTDAVRTAVEQMEIDTSRRNVLITHQFVTGAARCDSEDVSVGGTDNVDVEVFSDFDYVALGHIHRPQNVGSERVRYCGTPLKYSFSEAADEKSVTVIELAEKGSLTVRTVPLRPQRDMVVLRGSYDQLTSRDFYKDTTYCEDYLHIILTDEEDIPYAMSNLRTIYPNLMKLDYDNTRTRSGGVVTGTADVERRSPLELFEEFYEMQNGSEMSDIQTEHISSMIEKIWENRK